jgi:hypothetical protein
MFILIQSKVEVCDFCPKYIITKKCEEIMRIYSRGKMTNRTLKGEAGHLSRGLFFLVFDDYFIRQRNRPIGTNKLAHAAPVAFYHLNDLYGVIFYHQAPAPAYVDAKSANVAFLFIDYRFFCHIPFPEFK